MRPERDADERPERDADERRELVVPRLRVEPERVERDDGARFTFFADRRAGRGGGVRRLMAPRR